MTDGHVHMKGAVHIKNSHQPKYCGTPNQNIIIITNETVDKILASIL